jgi:hypothetical protein
MCGCWFTLAQNDLMDLMVTLFDKRNLEEKMITMVWNGHHLHSNLPIDQFHMNPCFYHRESVFHFQRKSLQVVISARKLGHLSQPASFGSKRKLPVFTALQPDQ